MKMDKHAKYLSVEEFNALENKYLNTPEILEAGAVFNAILAEAKKNYDAIYAPAQEAFQKALKEAEDRIEKE